MGKTKDILDRLILLEMAQYDRKTFDTKLTEKIVGALGEFVKYKIAMLNNELEWTEHWKTEIRRLITIEAMDIYLSPITGFKDKSKVLDNVLSDFREENKKLTYVRHGINMFKKYYKKGVKNKLTISIINEFLDNIKSYFKSGFKDDFNL